MRWTLIILMVLLLMTTSSLAGCSPASELGDPGEQGEQGDPGVQGELGATGLPGELGARGVQGDPGPRGVQGLPGDDGTPGVQGSQGQTGVSDPEVVAALILDSEELRGALVTALATDLKVDVALSLKADADFLVATQGSDGEQGIAGVAGINGTNGIAGVAGINGTNGIAGVAGINGTNGEDGEDGINGTNGEDGEDGINGTNGEDGEDGEDGPQGEQGEGGDVVSLLQVLNVDGEYVGEVIAITEVSRGSAWESALVYVPQADGMAPLNRENLEGQEKLYFTSEYCSGDGLMVANEGSISYPEGFIVRTAASSFNPAAYPAVYYRVSDEPAGLREISSTKDPDGFCRVATNPVYDTLTVIPVERMDDLSDLFLPPFTVQFR